MMIEFHIPILITSVDSKTKKVLVFGFKHFQEKSLNENPLFFLSAKDFVFEDLKVKIISNKIVCKKEEFPVLVLDCEQLNFAVKDSRDLLKKIEKNTFYRRTIQQEYSTNYGDTLF